MDITTKRIIILGNLLKKINANIARYELLLVNSDMTEFARVAIAENIALKEEIYALALHLDAKNYIITYKNNDEIIKGKLLLVRPSDFMAFCGHLGLVMQSGKIILFDLWFRYLPEASYNGKVYKSEITLLDYIDIDYDLDNKMTR